MTMPPPPDPGYPAPPWNPPPAGLDGPLPGRYGATPPQPGWYPPPGGYSPPPPRGTNGFAIAALIFGIIGGALLGIIFGFVALSQIKKSGQGGRGMAIAGLVLSGVWVLAIGALIAVAVATSAQRDSTGQVASGGTVSARELRTGDCLNNLRDSTDVRSLPAVPCAQPHEGEVFAVFDLPAGVYPGQAKVDSLSETGCGTRFGGYSSADPADERLFVVYPLQSNWIGGDREVACIATPLSGGLTTGSLKAD